MNPNIVTEQVIGAAITVHSELGPGLLEYAYESCLAYELARRKLKFERQKPIPVIYRNVKLDCGYTIDLLVADQVVVEVKAVVKLDRVFEAQLLTYLKLSGCPIGLLINFNVPRLREGIRRLASPQRSYPSQPSVVK